MNTLQSIRFISLKREDPQQKNPDILDLKSVISGFFVLQSNNFLERGFIMKSKWPKEVIEEIERASKMPIVYDEDSPKLTPELEKAFIDAVRERDLRLKKMKAEKKTSSPDHSSDYD